MQNVVRHGYIMVDVLLVISGFLLALPYMRAHFGLSGYPSAKWFYVKRFWRIFPSYALAVLLVLFLYALPQGRYSTDGFLVKDVFTHLTFTHNLFFDTYFLTPLPGVLWTMGVEAQFYVLFPLIALLFEARPRLTCLTLTLIAAAFRLWVGLQPDTIFLVNQLPAMLDLYACGMLAAYLYVKLSQKPARPAVSWAMFAAAVLALFVLMQIMYRQPVGDYPLIRRHQLIWRFPIGVVSGVFLLCGSLAPPVTARLLGNPVTRFLSAISYNFYIWHTFIAVRLKELRIPSYISENPSQAGEQPWQTRYTLLCFAAAIAAAALMTYLWEKPVMKRGLRRSEKTP